MPKESARVDLEPGQLNLHVENGSPLLSGAHRVFFVNLMGFEPRAEPVGYVNTSDALDPKLVADVVQYLRDQGVRPALNNRAQAAVRQLENAAADLETARIAGSAIKSVPPVEIQVPRLKRYLKPYQVPAVAHALGVKNAANFSVPGSGKTSVVYAVFALLKDRRELDKLLVIGPRSAFMPWEEEFYACFGKRPRSIRISGARRQRSSLFRAADERELILMTYQMATNASAEVISFLERHKSMLVLDESHNIKRLEGGTWAQTMIELGMHATRRMILTGTPAPHSAADLWSQMTFLWPNPPVLGARDQFKYRLEERPDEGIEAVRDQIAPLFWRTRKSDLHLPRPRFRRVRLKLRPHQRAIYTVLAAKVLSDVVRAPSERTKLRLWRKARMVRLLQAASNPALLTQQSIEFQIPPLTASGLSVDQLIQDYHKYETPVKIDFAVRLARQLVRRRHKVLIWSAFVHNILTLEKALAEFSPRVVYGDVPKDDDEDLEYNREKMIRDFRTSSRYPILIANPSACGESISLHRVCFHAIYVDRTFNGAHYMQSLDRIHRVGLEPRDKVHYYLLESQDTIDEVISSRLEEKHGRMLRLFDEELPVIGLDYAAGDFSEETEEERDFAALVRHLETQVAAAGR